jgi:hypothetical protein
MHSIKNLRSIDFDFLHYDAQCYVLNCLNQMDENQVIIKYQFINILSRKIFCPLTMLSIGQLPFLTPYISETCHVPRDLQFFQSSRNLPRF